MQHVTVLLSIINCCFTNHIIHLPTVLHLNAILTVILLGFIYPQDVGLCTHKIDSFSNKRHIFFRDRALMATSVQSTSNLPLGF